MIQADELKNALHVALQSSEVNADDAWSFVEEVTAGQELQLDFITLSPVGYDEVLGPNTEAVNAQVVLIAGGALYDFIFSATVRRYDVAMLSTIARIDERREIEQSVEGPPRQKVSCVIDFSWGTGYRDLHLVSFGGEGLRLSEFIRSLRRLFLAGGYA
jgi:hypothetical protein